MAVLANIAPYLLFSWSEQRISSGLAAVLSGTTPLLTLLLARAFGLGRLTPPRVLGLALGLAGVVLLAEPWHDGSRAVSLAGVLAGVLAALGAAACYAGSYVYARLLLTNRGMEPLVLAAAQLTLGAVLLSAAVPWIGPQPMTLSGSVVLSVVALGVLSTGIAYVLNYRLIQVTWPPEIGPPGMRVLTSPPRAGGLHEATSPHPRADHPQAPGGRSAAGRGPGSA
jgi:drug/metabolite transporter (DMT)-like permease